MIRCTAAYVDLDATRTNYQAITRYLAREAALNRNAGRGPDSPPGIIAVVKANAYGHGAVRVARALEEAGATWLAVADIEEGIELRASGTRARILVFGALSVSDLAGVSTTSSRQRLPALQRDARYRPRRISAACASAIT